jgi:glycosyltransferase involved in cell wall biosynthesis
MTGSASIGIYAYTKSAHETNGGIEAQVTHLAKALAARGHSVIIHCLANEDAGLAFANGDFSFGAGLQEVEERIRIFRPSHGPGIEGAIAENIKVSREYEESIIFCFGTRDGYVFDLAIAAKKELNIPLVSFVYFTIEERWYRSHFMMRGRSIIGLASAEEKQAFFAKGEDTVRRIVENSTLVIAPTHFVRGQLIAIAGVEASPKIKICYHGADTKIFNDDKADAWQARGDMLCAARLSIPQSCDKGFLWAAQFFASNLSALDVKQMIFCGAGNGHAVLKDYAEKQGVSERMNVCGFVGQTELAKKYNNASYLLIPSMMEAGCTAVVESVMAGCLPLALDSAGLAEIMESIGLDDYLIAGREEKLADGLTVIVPDDKATLALINRIGANSEKAAADLAKAQKIAREKFSISATTDRLLRLLDQAGLVVGGGSE